MTESNGMNGWEHRAPDDGGLSLPELKVLWKFLDRVKVEGHREVEEHFVLSRKILKAIQNANG